MGFVKRELAKLSRALDEGVGNPRYPEIYAAQQALAWALEPTGYRAPMAYLTDIPEGSVDCPECRNPPPS